MIKVGIDDPLHVFQLEQHNHELEIKNDVLTDQVEILRERLQALPASTAKEIFKSQKVRKYRIQRLKTLSRLCFIEAVRER